MSAGRSSTGSTAGPKIAAGVAAVALLVLAGLGFSGGFHFGSSGASAAPSQAGFIGGASSSPGAR
ncbi:MAG: hypothetical protein U0838_04405 [Chloroflexota bacterium]